jgi:hypothetical protein
LVVLDFLAVAMMRAAASPGQGVSSGIFAVSHGAAVRENEGDVFDFLGKKPVLISRKLRQHSSGRE